MQCSAGKKASVHILYRCQFFFPDIFDPQMAEFTEEEPSDIEGKLCP